MALLDVSKLGSPNLGLRLSADQSSHWSVKRSLKWVPVGERERADAETRKSGAASPIPVPLFCCLVVSRKNRQRSYFFLAGFTDWRGFFGTSFSITKSLPHFGQRREDRVIVPITVGILSDARQ